MAGQTQDVLINDRYDLVRVIGRGSTGTVYLAYDEQLDRPVAIKVLNDKARENQEVMGRFEREIHITARLQHPGVVNVFEKARTPEGLPCCVMSLAFGRTLEDYLRSLAASEDHRQEVTLVDRLTLFIKLLEVISYAHSQGVVHRDLKPANIVLGEYGEVLILDWGLARALDEHDDDPLEHFDDVFGGDMVSESGRKERSALSEIRQAPTTRYESDGERPRRSATAWSPVVGSKSVRSEVQPLSAADTVIGGTASTSSLRPATQDEGSHPKARGPVDSTAPRSGTTGAEQQRLSHMAQGATGSRRQTTGIGTDEEYAPDDLDRAAPARGAGAGIAEETTGRQVASPGSGTASSARNRTISTGRHRHVSSTFSAETGRSTRLGDVLGSPVYMSPEQARGEASTADQRADIYALGVILVELLTLHPPMEQRAGELLLQFIERVRTNDGWRSLKDLWPESPRSLQAIADRALAYDPGDRYQDSEELRSELSAVLDQLSASFSELERQRLEREREGAWLPVGRWNYLHQNDTEPFSEAVTAYEGEPVGQVLHPEMGGLLIGGCGMQIYPLSLNVTDDVRLTMEFSITGGSEFWIFMRGLPPTSAYAFRIGAWNGRWLSVLQ
ncbi:MAG: protein kinase domain-containing protein, partial [Planctomycetota bacterium]